MKKGIVMLSAIAGVALAMNAPLVTRPISKILEATLVDMPACTSTYKVSRAEQYDNGVRVHAKDERGIEFYAADFPYGESLYREGGVALLKGIKGGDTVVYQVITGKSISDLASDYRLGKSHDISCEFALTSGLVEGVLRPARIEIR